MRSIIPTLLLSAGTLAAACSLACGGGSSRAPRAATRLPAAAPATPAPSPTPPPPTSPPPAPSPAPPPPAPAFTEQPVHVPTGPLTPIPPDYVAQGGDPVFIPTPIAADRLSDRHADDVPARLKVVAWNIEKGARLARIADELATNPLLAGADFLLLNEVTRRDPRSDPPGVDVARELATRLRMNYVFGIEWDRRLVSGSGDGEVGLAILSKYPLGDAVVIRHVPLHDWWADESRLGGRATLAATARVGPRLLRLYSSHLDTRDWTGLGRARQAAEIRADAAIVDRPRAQVVGGDLNTWSCNPLLADCTRPPAAEVAVREFLDEGWSDGTDGYLGHTQLGRGFFPQRLDWIFHRGLDAAFPGDGALGAGGSDHFPVWMELTLR